MQPDRTPLVVTASAVAAAAVAATMLLAGSGGLAAAATVVLVAVQVALLLAVHAGAVRARQFLLAWSAQAGLTHLVAGEGTVESALVYLGVGLLFGAVVVVGLTLWRPAVPEPAEPGRSGDTQPLPVDGD
ncbi:hypothetical protein [Actinomycetospora aeridis]|uniref:Uncharacterized protein n=1 Tax=Actinomycetospora aeridis TaxID=3129231 RepID=A0ABU8NAI3_9PSEU